MDNQTLKSQFFRSISVHLRELHVLAPFFRVYLRFRSISVHSFPGFSFLCAGKLTRNSTVMAGTTKDMSLIKQVLQLKQAGESNRGVRTSATSLRLTIPSWNGCSMPVHRHIRTGEWKSSSVCSPDTGSCWRIPNPI